ncbi:unnamed protein product [Caenorhabditis angaria]|uniref:non-specific serine/threonine protein kinase n=1 Tax=Caenorhabditis angaria TaxID=860376 RepID=A0A9P1IJD8_9PELO|nr:unnamed protein product [Caenorhabditis angaria]
MDILQKKEMNKDEFVILEGGYIVPAVKKYVPNLKEKNGKEMLKFNEVFRERYHILGLIGRGGYGQIYYAQDITNGDELVIKTEPKIRKGNLTKRMLLEQKILYRLQGRPHVPIMIGSGHTDIMNFIAMQLLGPNIGDLKKKSPVKRLSPSTVSRIILQGIAALRDTHSLGYIHRDIKPANMCFGISQQTRHVLKLVDYGLVRRYKNDDGSWRKQRYRPGFRGTLRYVSPRVHDKKEQSPADDLVSMAYSGVELLLMNLPWKLVAVDELKEAKEEFHSSSSPYLALCGPHYSLFCRAIFSLSPMDDPDYSALQSLIFDMMGGKTMKDSYDWEENYREVFSGHNNSSDGTPKNGKKKFDASDLWKHMKEVD